MTAPRGHKTSVRAAILQLHNGSSGTVCRSPAACKSHTETQNIWKPLGQPDALARRLLGHQLPERDGRLLLPRPLSPSLTLLHLQNGAQGATFRGVVLGVGGIRVWGHGGEEADSPSKCTEKAGKPGAQGSTDPSRQPASRQGLTGSPGDLQQARRGRRSTGFSFVFHEECTDQDEDHDQDPSLGTSLPPPGGQIKRGPGVPCRSGKGDSRTSSSNRVNAGGDEAAPCSYLTLTCPPLPPWFRATLRHLEDDLCRPLLQLVIAHKL